MIFRMIKIWTYLSFILSQITRLTVGRTDRILIAIPCGAVKNVLVCCFKQKNKFLKERLF